MPKPEYRESSVSLETKPLEVTEDITEIKDSQAWEEELLPEPELRPRDRSHWPTILGLAVFIAGGAIAWHYFQPNLATKAQTTAPAAAPKPRGIPVKLATVETATVQSASEFVGSLEAPRSAIITPEIEGRISDIAIAEGDRVEKGQTIARTNSDDLEAQLMVAKASLDGAKARLAELEAGSRPEEIALARARLNQALARLDNERSGASPEEIAQAQAQIEVAQSEAELAKTRVNRYAELQQQGAISQDQLDQYVKEERTTAAKVREAERRLDALRKGRSSDIEQLAAAAEQERQALRQLENGAREEEIDMARSQVAEAEARVRTAEVKLQNTRIVAPFSGIIGKIPVKIGDFLSKGDTLTTVTENQFLDLQMSVPLERGPELREGQTVEGTDAKGNALGEGRISFISPRVDTSSQTILAKASFDNSQEQLRDGQFIRAKLIWNETTGAIVPTSAISRLGGQTFVFVAETKEGNLIAAQKPVKLGEIQGNNYHILEGLQAGEKIVVSGILNLSNGVPIIPE